MARPSRRRVIVPAFDVMTNEDGQVMIVLDRLGGTPEAPEIRFDRRGEEGAIYRGETAEIGILTVFTPEALHILSEVEQALVVEMDEEDPAFTYIAPVLQADSA